MRLLKPLAILAALVAALSCAKKQDLPFDMPEVKLPAIPSYTVSLTDFNAVGDGVTTSLQKARETRQVPFLKPQNGRESPFCSSISHIEVLCSGFPYHARAGDAVVPRKKARAPPSPPAALDSAGGGVIY